MGLFSWLTSAPKVVDTATDLLEKGASGIDKLFFTDEEKADMAKAVMDQWLKVQAAVADEGTTRSITRRIIACAFTGTFLTSLIAAAIAFPFNADYAAYLYAIARELGTPVTTIIIFYFGYYGVTKILEKK